MYLYICIYTCMYASIHTHTEARTHTSMALDPCPSQKGPLISNNLLVLRGLLKDSDRSLSTTHLIDFLDCRQRVYHHSARLPLTALHNPLELGRVEISQQPTSSAQNYGRHNDEVAEVGQGPCLVLVFPSNTALQAC